MAGVRPVRPGRTCSVDAHRRDAHRQRRRCRARRTGPPFSDSERVELILTAGFYAQYDKAPLLDLVERALGHRDGVPLPITPVEPGSPLPYLPDTRGMAGTYAATSLPPRQA